LRAARRVLDDRVVRILAGIAVVTALVAGCAFDRASAPAAGDNGDPASPASECAVAADCTLAATTCCACDEFAIGAADGYAGGCDDVECPAPPPGACPALIADCVDGVCTAVCAPVTCDLSCSTGFASDAAGCLTCVCAEPMPGTPQCTVDTDCVEVAADCCGCARGGADTAVAATEADAFSQSLMCPSDPTESACPEVNVCDPTVAPHCRSGQCVLDAASGDSDVATCGRPDLPPCPDGTVCVLNADSEAGMDGVGTCQTP